MFRRILIANRGEIALRIIRACHEMGIEAVCVYSEVDRDAAYLKLADRAICIGPGPAKESYLNISRIIAAAEVADVDAIHPGYGFLAERADFAEVCRDCKIEFIGPSPEAMTLLGDKVEAKRAATKAKVPIFPGSEGAIEDEDEAAEIAEKIGYPVIIKAAAGGGGRGMRVCRNEATLRSNIKNAQQEAQAAFGNGAVFIEKFLEHARHVEIQDDRGSSTAIRSPPLRARLLRAAPAPEAHRGGPRAGRGPEEGRPASARPRRELIKLRRLLPAPPPSSFSWTRSTTSTCSRSTPGCRSSTPSPRW